MMSETSKRRPPEQLTKVESTLFLDIVIRKGTSIFQLLSSEDQSLLVGRDAFFVLDLRLDIIDRVRGLDFKGDGFASEGLDKNLHPSTETKD